MSNILDNVVLPHSPKEMCEEGNLSVLLVGEMALSPSPKEKDVGWTGNGDETAPPSEPRFSRAPP